MSHNHDLLKPLRSAHGEFVTTVLAQAKAANPAPLVEQLVAHNRWAVAQLRAVPQRAGAMPPASGTMADVSGMLAELAASCADLGAAVRDLPAEAVECGSSMVDAIIGYYHEQTARLRQGGTRL
ncbi:hypothetical protein [Herpetosiphon gulosus]|uniref:Uncharacterized protein n=1 Tax=Herpetosiphon gulosus TaxID=1973496 RepID=A0ABP9WXU3_9CHLR